MFWSKSHISVKEVLGAKKDLRDFTDEELYEFLEKNQDIPASALACICSEILRRQRPWKMEK